MAMQRELVSGKDLREGDVYFPEGKPGVICKITSIAKSKPGKHGSAKSVSSAKDLFTSDNICETFRDGGQKVYCMRHPGKELKVVHALTKSELIIDLEAIENNSLLVEKFGYGRKALKAKISELFPDLSDTVPTFLENPEESLVISYSEIPEEKEPYVFWDLFIAPSGDVQSLEARERSL